MSPQRIQRQHTKGWRMPEGAVYVGRPSKWGNPFDWRDYLDDGEYGAHEMAWGNFADNFVELEMGERHARPYPTEAEVREQLAGKDLVCWCPDELPCHADYLLEMANR